MSILNRRERERLVLDLYNQGKTIREIAKEVRMSFRDIGAILNKAVEEKTEGSKEQEQQQLSLSTQAYKLFSERKTPLEVAIELNLGESEATQFYREYWKLKQTHNLNMVYEDLRGDIEPFLKLYRLSKSKGMGVKQVVDALAIANGDLPDIQRRYERLKREVNKLEFNKQQSHKALTYFNNKIETQRKALTSYHISCIRQRREIRKLYNEKERLEAVVTEFKRNNEEYNKIKQVVEEKVKDVLINGKLILKLATFSVIKSFRMNPELCTFVLYSSTSVGTASTTHGSNYLSLMSGKQHQQQAFNDSYTALILEEAEKLYNKLTTKLTNEVMTAAAAAIKESSLPLPVTNNNRN